MKGEGGDEFEKVDDYHGNKPRSLSLLLKKVTTLFIFFLSFSDH